MEIRPYLMENPVMHYAWGTRGKEAFIPRLLNLSNWDQSEPWAELWMGAHPKAPSHVKTSQGEISLRDFIDAQPEVTLGTRVIKLHGKELPFLMKVLSASEILSIQAHPNKQQAELLHRQDPKHYPDANHKPELAIALDNLNALVGLKDETDLREILKRIPELETLTKAHNNNGLCKKIFETLITLATSSPEKVAATVKKLKHRLESKSVSLSFEEQLFIDVAQKYPEHDVGLLLLFVLEAHIFKSHEGVFIPAGVPHAYIRGNIIECMANSDNVVRAGLTPKFKDTKTLLDIMDYSIKPQIYNPPKTKGTFTYKVPATEFIVHLWKTTRGEVLQLKEVDGPAILLVVEGQITIHWPGSNQMIVRSGNSVFIPAALKDWNIAAHSDCLVFLSSVP